MFNSIEQNAYMTLYKNGCGYTYPLTEDRLKHELRLSSDDILNLEKFFDGRYHTMEEVRTGVISLNKQLPNHYCSYNVEGKTGDVIKFSFYIEYRSKNIFEKFMWRLAKFFSI